MPHPAVQSDILVVHFDFTDAEISGIRSSIELHGQL